MKQRKKRIFTNPALNKIEKYFEMPFTDVINKLHWEEKKSINELSKLCDISRAVFNNHAKKLNLGVRNSKQAAILNPNSGEKNGMYGRNKDNCSICKAKSNLMKRNNPANNDKTRIQMSKSIAEYFKKNPLPQEIEFENTLKEFGVEYTFQYPLNRYVIDFFIHSLKLCVEIDSSSKWGAEKRRKAAIKDTLLNSLGFEVLRINKKKLSNKSVIIDILKTNNIIR